MNAMIEGMQIDIHYKGYDLTVRYGMYLKEFYYIRIDELKIICEANIALDRAHNEKQLINALSEKLKDESKKMIKELASYISVLIEITYIHE